jgi:hypothetical protein
MSTLSGIGGGTGALQSAQLGISRGMANVDRDAQAVASRAGGDDGMVNSLVDAKSQALDVEASAKAFSIADKTLGTLIDIKA